MQSFKAEGPSNKIREIGNKQQFDDLTEGSTAQNQLNSNNVAESPLSKKLKT